jgi:hypothetical protein
VSVGTFLACAWLLAGLGAVLWIAVDVDSQPPVDDAVVFLSVIAGILLGPVTLPWWLKR